MTAPFQTPVDIANRALQHCGAERIVAFDDDSRNASEVAFVYDKLRQAELRRNAWKFSIRNAYIRALDENSRRLVAPAWAAGSYGAGRIVSHDGVLWYTTVTTSTVPGAAAADWLTYAGPRNVSLYDATTTYQVGELVYLTGFPNVVYMASTPNLDETPPGGDWITVTGATTTAIVILEPTERYNGFLYLLPAGFLRYAPDPKRGAFGIMGGPTGAAFQDHNFEGEYLVSNDPYPILLRFAADIVDVTRMDPLFCEGLGARIGLEVCEILTQSGTKLGTIAQVYDKFMTEARTVNGIETGPMEADEDEWITVRV